MPRASFFAGAAALLVQIVPVLSIPTAHLAGSSSFSSSVSSPSSRAATVQDYTSNSVAAINALNDQFYDVDTGIWANAWWNSANALTTIADFTSLQLDEANQLNLGGFIQNTWTNAQKTNVQAVKTVSEQGMTTSKYCLDRKNGCMVKREFLNKRGYADFLDDFYDDEGWWSLAMIHAYDATGNQAYLNSAVEIFNDMQTGTGTPCGGGIWWSKDRTYVNAIANELYLAVAASLANRIPSNASYLQIAQSQWNWFDNSGMINSQNLINDGLTSDCKNNGQQTWTYNQGVILGGLVELARATKDLSLITKAQTIAHAAINTLSTNGILHEVGNCELQAGNCGSDGQQFKGVFIRNLRYLYDAAPEEDFKNFIITNADSIWSNDRSGAASLGVDWAGPYVTNTGSTQSAALDALVAAIAVS